MFGNRPSTPRAHGGMCRFHPASQDTPHTTLIYMASRPCRTRIRVRTRLCLLDTTGLSSPYGPSSSPFSPVQTGNIYESWAADRHAGTLSIGG